MNQICNLASSGLNQTMYIFLGIFILATSIVLIKLQAKGVKVFLLIIGIFFAVQSGYGASVFAGGSMDCPKKSSANVVAGGNTAPGGGSQSGQIAVAGLVDDNPTLDYDVDNSRFSKQFQVLPNDDAPNDDPFDTKTLKLLSDYVINDGYGEWHLILEDNSLPLPPPESGPGPGENWRDDSNVIGWWSLDLTCDTNDTDNCNTYSGPGGTELECVDASLTDTCWPSGKVDVVFKSSTTGPADFSINYTVKTQSGLNLIPATITVSLPSGPPEPSPITAASYEDSSSNCGEWPTNYSLNLMNYVSTLPGSGSLLTNTIDLNPLTSEIDRSITVNDGNPANYITFTVDENTGIVTMTTPSGGSPGSSNTYHFDYTIKDDNDFISNIGTISLQFGCA